MDPTAFVAYAKGVALVIIALAAAIVIITQRNRIGRFVFRFGEHKELEVELGKFVQAEVDKAKSRSLKELVTLDLELIPLWERRGFHSPVDSAKKLDAIAARIEAIENALEKATTSEWIDYQTVLRELYWQWLQQARKHFASSGDYQQIRQHVVERLHEVQRITSQQAAQ